MIRPTKVSFLMTRKDFVVKHRGLAFSFVLVVASTSMMVRADEPSLSQWATQKVHDSLLRPLKEHEGRTASGVFSRSRPPPRERRVRVLQTSAVRDKNGRSFLRFAVDVRFGKEWIENDIVGCVYTPSGDLFVKKGEAYRPAPFLLGKNAEPVPGVCEAAPSS